MSGNTQPDFREAKLDPDLLSTHFKVQTNWHVITGASCSGKTTMVDQLASKGFQISPEVARLYFEGEFAKGRTIDEIREDKVTFTNQIYGMWLKLLGELRADRITFLDRGIPDALTFYRYIGLDPNLILPDCFQHRYASVFLLNRLPYQKDGVRAGDDAVADYFESWTLKDYIALGYNVVRVPVLAPEERLTFILETLTDGGIL